MINNLSDKIILEKILFDIGGNVAKIPDDEPDFYNLFTRGYLINKHADKLIKGEMCQCHKNSAFLWNSNRDKYKIMTGYALSSIGIWHQHSWILENDEIIETTVDREKYFGYELTFEESKLLFEQYQKI